LKKPLDIFSKQAAIYKSHRPTYPIALYDDILNHVKHKEVCWDCGTGNGQVAVELSKHFKTVYATDISERQIAHAEQKPNIHFSIERAEETTFDDNQFDLITVAQAVHWFDNKAFNKEVKRVAKSDAILCVWGYGLFSVGKAIDKLVNEFYNNFIGSYWNEERKHIDDQYASINFDFEEIKDNNTNEIIVNWNLTDLTGYFNSWSSVQNYKDVHDGENPVDGLMLRIGEQWKDHSTKEVRFPIFKRMWKIKK
jgi:ubiquinone/menaquinone biosynthesis C-methylase UbiE